MVDKIYFETKAVNFIKNEISNKNLQVIEKKINFKAKKIEIFYLGNTLSKANEIFLFNKLKEYHLNNTSIELRQIFDIEKGVTRNMQNVKEAVIEELYSKNRDTLEVKNKEISLLNQKISEYEKKALLPSSLSDELKVFYPELTDFDILAGSNKFILLLNQKNSLTKKDESRIKNWISNKSGLSDDNVLIIKKLP